MKPKILYVFNTLHCSVQVFPMSSHETYVRRSRSRFARYASMGSAIPAATAVGSPDIILVSLP